MLEAKEGVPSCPTLLPDMVQGIRGRCAACSPRCVSEHVCAWGGTPLIAKRVEGLTAVSARFGCGQHDVQALTFFLVTEAGFTKSHCGPRVGSLEFMRCGFRENQ
jgi:hypothetical protein